METNRLYQFKIIVDSGGLIKASDLLGISGGGLSKSMKSLELEMGLALFTHRGRGLELTLAGKKLYERVPAILKSIDELNQFKEMKSHEAGAIRFVSFEVFTTYFLALLPQRAFESAIEIREAIPGEMETLIADGDSDIGITYLPIPHADVEFRKVGRIKMGIFGLRDQWQEQRITDVPFVAPITPVRGTPSGVRGLDGWPDHLFARNIRFRVETMETALQLCRNGAGVAFLPEFVVRLANQQAAKSMNLVELPLPERIKPIHRDIHIVTRKDFPQVKFISALARVIRLMR